MDIYSCEEEEVGEEESARVRLPRALHHSECVIFVCDEACTREAEEEHKAAGKSSDPCDDLLEEAPRLIL